MEIKEMNMEELETRQAEIATELETADKEGLEKLSAEMDSIEQRRAELREEIEQRKADIETVANGEDVVEIRNFIEEEKPKMENIEVRNTPAYIDAYANMIKSGDDKECRALISENVSGTVPVPEFVYEIVKTAWDKEGIMSRVKKAYLKGNLKVGFEISGSAASAHTEGDTVNLPSEETLVLGIVNIVPISYKKWITISDEVFDLRGEEFLRYIYDEVSYKIAKAAADALVGKIAAAATASTTSAVGVPAVTATTPSMTTIASAIAELSDQATNPVVVMNKQTWPVYKALQYANGYGADPFEGCEVVFNNSLPAFSAATSGSVYAIVGDFGEGAIANFPNGDEITIKFDDLSLAEKDLIKIVGREYVGLGIVGPGCFVNLKK